MDTVAASWVLGSLLVVFVSVAVCGCAVRAIPRTTSPEPPDLFGGSFIIFGVFLVAGSGFYLALAYWLGRAGGFWAVAGIVAVVLVSLTGCVWIVRSTRKEPSSFDGYPFVGFIAIGISALIALALGLEGIASQE